MDAFQSYIKMSKTAVEKIGHLYTTLSIVIGNESCDLDSMVSALALAFFYMERESSKETLVIPILNMHSDRFHLRPLNNYMLKKAGIDKKYLIFRDQLDIESMVKFYNVEIRLVDHHLMHLDDQYMLPCVIEVFDHRPIDPKSKVWDNKGVLAYVKNVASCASLVTNKIVTVHEDVVTKSLATLLYSAITFDTIGYDPEAGRVKDFDIYAAKDLERLAGFKKYKRKELFDELWAVYKDISHLNPYDLLLTDLKKVDKYPVPVVPMTVKSYLQKHDVHQIMKIFCHHNQADLMVVLGLEVTEESGEKDIERDLAIFSIGNETLRNRIINKLKSKCNLYDLKLIEEEVDVPDIVYFRQTNVKLTRKHIIPLLEDAIGCKAKISKSSETSESSSSSFVNSEGNTNEADEN